MRTHLMQIAREIPEWPERNTDESTTTFSGEEKSHYTVRLETKYNGKIYGSDYTSVISMEKARKGADDVLLLKLNV